MTCLPYTPILGQWHPSCYSGSACVSSVGVYAVTMSFQSHTWMPVFSFPDPWSTGHRYILSETWNSLLSSTGDRLSFRGRPPRPLLVIFQWLPPALGIRQKLPDTLSQRAWFGSALMSFLTACLLTPFPCHCLARVVPPLVLTSTLPSTLHYLLTPPGWAAFPASKCSYPELDPQPSGRFPTAVLCLINAPKKPCN